VLPGRFIRGLALHTTMSSLSRAVSISAAVRLSVCLFTDSREPSGIGEHMITLAGQLRCHCQLSFVCPATPAGKPFLDRAASLGVETFALNWQGNERYTGHHFVRWLCERGFDVFHGHAGIGWEGHAGIQAARRAGIPVVIRTEHLPYLLTNPRDRAQHTRTCHRLDRLLCVSHESAASYLDARLPADLLEVIHNGISAISSRRDRRDIRAACRIPQSGKIILTVARMTEQKGYHHLLAAVPAVVGSEPRAHFLWAGAGPLERDLRQLCDHNGLGGCVSFLGHRTDVADLMAAADLFVLPSLFEGLPLVVLEAMTAGLPVIGTRVCGTTEAVMDGVTGRLVPPGDAPALASAILDTFSHPNRTARLAAAARRHVEQEFSAERMAQQTLLLYRELVAERATAAIAATAVDAPEEMTV
jgi:glycosyltransferase involved in cell wall biosynthesis